MKTNRFYDLENCTNDCKMAIANLLKQYNIDFEEHEDEKVLRKLKAWIEWILEDQFKNLLTNRSLSFILYIENERK